MKCTMALVSLLVGGIMLTSALPQYSQGGSSAVIYGGPSPAGSTTGGLFGSSAGGVAAPASALAPASVAAPDAAATPALAPAPVAAAAPAAAPASASAAAAAPAASSGGSGASLSVECKNTETAPGSGQFKIICEGVDKDAISLRSEHVLWLSGDKAQSQVLDIEIPNYKIEELIKAGFKPIEGKGPQINVLLKKPEQSYDAQIDKLKISGAAPKVQLKYEPVDKKLVHFPNDKPYSPLTGPILPPLAG